MTHCKIRLSFGSVHFKQQFLFMNVIWKYWKRWKYKDKSIGQFIFHLTHEGAEKSTPSLSAMTKLIPKERKKSDISILLRPFFSLYSLKLFKKLLIRRHMLTPRPQQCICILCWRSNSDIFQKKGARGWHPIVTKWLIRFISFNKFLFPAL